MEVLNAEFAKKLKQIAKSIQKSEELSAYLEEEGEEEYAVLREKFEPEIHELHQLIAINYPLQIIAFEKELLDPDFEGLYLPRILGYSVLRGEVGDKFKYKRPQGHFSDVLMAFSSSSNFDVLKTRVGQAIQIGFALSSDIWITNLLNDVVVSQVQQYLLSQKLPKYRTEDGRRKGYFQFERQFRSAHFMSADFPENKEDFLFLFTQLKRFLLHRVGRYSDNSNLLNKMLSIIRQKDYRNNSEFVQLLAIVANFFDVGEHHDEVSTILNETRKSYGAFESDYFEFVKEILTSGIALSTDQDTRFISHLDMDIQDDITHFYGVLKEIHNKGYSHEDSVEAVKKFYYRHKGMSLVNECLRLKLLAHFERFLENLEESDYPEYFEFNKVFTVYIQVFSNEEFNQSIKSACMKYIRRLLRHFTDKRGKDYQDIKKFVSSTFLDLGFMTEKQIAELFKTRRKKRTEKV